jgi:hypothetical protein
MRRRVTDEIEAVRILVRHDGQFGILVHHIARVHEHSIHLARERGLGQTGANRGRHLAHGNCLVELPDRSVRQRHIHHVCHS